MRKEVIASPIPYGIGRAMNRMVQGVANHTTDETSCLVVEGLRGCLSNNGVAELALRFYRETSFATPDER